MKTLWGAAELDYCGRGEVGNTRQSVTHCVSVKRVADKGKGFQLCPDHLSVSIFYFNSTKGNLRIDYAMLYLVEHKLAGNTIF